MKKLLKITLLFFTLLVFLPGSAFSQKYGHMNTGNLLASLSEVKAADQELQTYQEQLAKAFKTKVDAFKKEYESVAKQAQGGTLTPVQIQDKEKDLKDKQQALAKEEQENAGKVQNKRAELLEPVLKKVDEAIQSVAKEGGYTMIFETSMMNTILFAKDSDDVLPLVKAKLGIQ